MNNHIASLMIIAGIILGLQEQSIVGKWIWDCTPEEIGFRLSILGLLAVGGWLLWTPKES